MRKIILTFSLVMGALTFCTAQEIEMKMTIMGHKFTQNGQKLSWNELLDVTKSNDKAYKFIKKGKSQNIISAVLGFVGGGFIGVPLGQSMSGQNPNWSLAYIGGGIALIGLPISISSSKNTKKGIDNYNLSMKSASVFQFKPEFEVIANGNGFGLSMNF